MMKTMQRTLPFPAALILGLALLAAGCAMPGLEKPAAPEPGTLRVSLGADSKRTLLPETYKANSFYYALTFTATGGPALTEQPTASGSIAQGESSGDFTLAVGTWSLEAKGFASEADATDPANALVGGSKSGIEIASAAGTAISVALIPDTSKLTQNTTGTLAYDISFPAGVTQASLAVTPGGNLIDLLGTDANTGSLALASGVYDLELCLYMPGKVAAKRLTAHIYDGLATKAEYVFAEADFAEHTTAAITAFALNDGTNNYAGRIDHAARTITVFVPPSVVVSGLTASIAHAGVFLASSPPTPIFTAPVRYTVTLEDGAEIEYNVSVANEASSAADLQTLLAGATDGDTLDDPILVKISADVDLGDPTGDWTDILSAIAGGQKYVSLDLSECAMGTVTEYDPGTADTGEQYITSLVLPDTAESIKASDYANPTFRNFDNLKTLAASGVETIGDNALSRCTGLTSLDLPAATSIGNYTFTSCHSLAFLSLPTAETIGEMAFYGCTSLTFLSLPTATSIGSFAFQDCTGLTSLSLPAATSIDNHAFNNCHGLTSLSLPAATSIDVYAFSRCTGLTSLDLPVVENIGDSAFGGCTGLTTVSLPALLTTIMGNPFRDCVNLTSISVDAANLNYTARNGMLLNKAETILIAYPAASGPIILNTITSIGDDAFSSCTGLTSLDLPTATSIGYYAFGNCTGLTSLDLPAATSIGDSAFNGCTGLTFLDLSAATSIGYSAFEGCTGLTFLDLSAATSINSFAFRSTGGTALTVTLGATAPMLGSYLIDYVSTPKTVTVQVPTAVPDTGSDYGPIPATYNTDTTTNNWGNAFRGKGWNGTSYRTGTVNGNVTLEVTYITP
jgi:hypothetical protein